MWQHSKEGMGKINNHRETQKRKHKREMVIPHPGLASYLGSGNE
jgi:hypothetical protein